MRIRAGSTGWGRVRLTGIIAGALLAVYALRGPLAQVAGLALAAALLCFLAAPLTGLYERKFSRSVAALLCLLTLAGFAALLLLLLLPAMLRELTGLARTLPNAVNAAANILDRSRVWLESLLPGLNIPVPDRSLFSNWLDGLASGTFSFVVNAADVIGRASMAAVLAYFFLCDRDRLLLLLELLLPQAVRHKAVRAGMAVGRELRLYLRAQLMIATAVGALSTLALRVIGVRSALVLGPFIGLMNMIPYFGPFIGGVPAVLIALGDSPRRAGLALLALAVVQQLDGSWISPRIMGNLTGFSPALVLVGIFAGARVGGIGGMLLALPLLMTIRTVFRVFVQKCENI